MLTLQNDTLKLIVVPGMGGGVLKFEAFGRQVFRPGKGPAPTSTDLASFVMLPYCNRMAAGKLGPKPTDGPLKPNLPKEPHPIHGEGWVSSWDVDHADDRQAELSLSHTPSAGRWPWAFRARQTYTLSGHRLVHSLCLENRSDSLMPAGLGFHPYFSYRAGDFFQASVKGMWACDEDKLPLAHHLIEIDKYWPRGQLDTSAGLDNCFTGWTGSCTLKRRDITVHMSTSGNLPFLHIYAPEGEHMVCAEPVSHVPNALNQMDAPPMKSLQPGDMIEAAVTYDIALS